jgi:hypothetical protein
MTGRSGKDGGAPAPMDRVGEHRRAGAQKSSGSWDASTVTNRPSTSTDR